MRFLDMISAYFERRQIFLKTFAELDSCTDRQLSDIGISRSDIARLAHEQVNIEMESRGEGAGLNGRLAAA
jgi:uncharacterized protein YjiS (DUF1127 family)